MCSYQRLMAEAPQQIVQHLHDALAVRHRGWQVRREVDEERVPGAAAHEGAARLVYQRRHLGRLGRDRQRARLDAPGIEQVADQAVHLVGLPVDDAERYFRVNERFRSLPDDLRSRGRCHCCQVEAFRTDPTQRYWQHRALKLHHLAARLGL